jgi:hypothetical protein
MVVSWFQASSQSQTWDWGLPNLISLSLLPRDHFWAGNLPSDFPLLLLYIIYGWEPIRKIQSNLLSKVEIACSGAGRVKLSSGQLSFYLLQTLGSACGLSLTDIKSSCWGQLVPVILSAQEAEICKILVWGQLRQKVRPYLKNTQHTSGWSDRVPA